ncbi:hypothetical protein HYC85_010468 [Camellia sinensis]|uniref:Uncharacterized protein n=1 Tax=Camellia sinensis TaxID=4442 RepID=A0A7J7HKL4_CAMSI|nr:hypothetical protein HYC85_010468 [Camellia sinensis]
MVKRDDLKRDGSKSTRKGEKRGFEDGFNLSLETLTWFGGDNNRLSYNGRDFAVHVHYKSAFLLVSRAPKIQRLVTPLTLQRKQARITDKKKRIAKAKEEAVEYHKLLATSYEIEGILNTSRHSMMVSPTCSYPMPTAFVDNTWPFLPHLVPSGLIFEQLFVIYALPNLFVSSLTLILPFFPTGTSERMEEEGDVAIAFTLERFYFGDNVLPCFESRIPMLKNRLQELPDLDNIRFLLMTKTIR